MKKEDNLRLKKEEKKILDYYVDFCEKNKLQYFISYGTLLGAVRHKGFIPWDDDIDVHMKPDDYKKFIELFKNKNGYILQNISTEKYFHSTFSKIRKNNTCMVEEDWQYLNIHKGINIDIFPLFPYPDKKIDRKLFNFKLKLANVLVSKNNKTTSIKNKIIFGILKLIPRNITNKWVEKLILNMLNYKGNYSNYKSELKNEIFKTKWFEDSVKLSFENTLYDSPKEYKEMLEELYGDYMTPPPVNERYGHGEGKIIISFDKNYEDLNKR